MFITVYGKQNCIYCLKAKQDLQARLIEFQYFDVFKDLSYIQLLELKEKTNMTTVPIIFNGDKLIGGYDKLKEFLNVL